MLRIKLVGIAVFAFVALAATAVAEDKEGGTIKLFNGKDLSGWRIFLDPKAKTKVEPESVFFVKDGDIVYFRSGL